MAQEQQLPEIKLDPTQLYREEIFTDRKAGTLRRLVPIKSDGSEDSSRPVLYSGQTQLLTPRVCCRWPSSSMRSRSRMPARSFPRR